MASKRIAYERCEPLGRTVGYSIRLESRRSVETKLLMCTTGVLVRGAGGGCGAAGELSASPSLRCPLTHHPISIAHEVLDMIMFAHPYERIFSSHLDLHHQPVLLPQCSCGA